MLTERAQKYLQTLKRVEAVPTPEVAGSLRSQGAPVVPAWLDFHDRYAGYIEPIGRDTAIWGLMHREAMFVDDGKVVLDHIVEDGVDQWFALCADVHGSYRYELDDTGTFWGSPARSFDVKVERNALIWSFSYGRKTQYLLNVVGKPTLDERFRKDLEGQVDEVASDDYSRYYVNDKYLIREVDGKFVLGWERI